jgi:cell division protein FtsB
MDQLSVSRVVALEVETKQLRAQLESVRQEMARMREEVKSLQSRLAAAPRS